MTQNRKIVLAARPTGIPVESDFQLETETIRPLQEGEVLVRNTVFAIDPATRNFLDDRPGYMDPLPIGGTIRTMILGVVVESRNPSHKAGELIRAFAGWEDYSIIDNQNITIERLTTHPGVPLTAYMGALGWSGITAYVGLHELGVIDAGQTVVISAAAGAVGGVAGQIARLRGCRTVGIVGSPAKADIITGELGYDAAVNYRDCGDLAAALQAALPGGADIYYDNVGGEILDTMLPLMKDFGRIVICGMVADYNAGGESYPIRNLWQILVKRATMRGFLAYEYPEMLKQAEHDLAKWIVSGALKPMENVTTGLENTPAAFIRLMSGKTVGKTIVRLTDDVDMIG